MSEAARPIPLDVPPFEGREGDPERSPPFEHVAFVGIGLINGSLARDVRRLGLARRTSALARRPETAARALELGLVDVATTEPGEALAGADLVVLGVPVGALGEAAATIAGHLGPDALVTDVGSVKASVIGLVAPHLDMRRFVPGHPVAGTENSGPDAAVANLYRDRWCILTPTAETDPGAVARVSALWRAVGARVEVMDAEHHDHVLAMTSHLPHLLAFNIVNVADSLEGILQCEILRYAAGGFTDFTRIASSDPVLWRDVFLLNRSSVLEVLARYLEDLAALQKDIRLGKGEALVERFRAAQSIRRGVIQAGQAYTRRPLNGSAETLAGGPLDGSIGQLLEPPTPARVAGARE